MLLLNGVHNTIHHSLPLQFEVENRGRDEWRGRAIIPLDYLPPQVTKMNAYAIHGSGSRRVYEALYPTPRGLFTNPDLYSSSLAFFYIISADYEQCYINLSCCLSCWGYSKILGGILELWLKLSKMFSRISFNCFHSFVDVLLDYLNNTNILSFYSHRLEFFQQLDISSVSSHMKMNSFSHLWLQSINQNSQQINW